MEDKFDLIKLLDFIDPSVLDYHEWLNVGIALKHEGYTANDWDQWSGRDSARYKAGECFRKWDTFQGASGSPITGATITQLAKDNGWEPNKRYEDDYELDWESVIGNKDDLRIIDTNWVEGREIKEPKYWNPVLELTKYLETIFESTENVGYVTDSWLNEESQKYLPTKGDWSRTAGQLIQELNKCNGDIGAVLGDYKEEVGAWIRFNPLDGNGVKNENVTDFRYALVESDKADLEKQNAIIRELELPVACLVHSGKKSIHAIVRVDASNYDEYRKRVDYLYKVCNKNGLDIDSQNRNPSRLSRMPGVTRNGKKQFLIDTNIGKANWDQWYEWIEGINDDLPEPESLTDFWDNLPELAPPLIHDVLRQGHKMLMAGPSKAGKSFALIELCIAIAEGKEWLGWKCAKGKVMYVNLELDRASCLHRFKDVYNALEWTPNSLKNIDIWNLRGKSVPMDKLAPKLIRRAQKKDYIAIVIDPIYKVITGDENSADQMAHFTNQFDKVCTELGSSVIYCHHHSKGSQGNKKSMDRASGSGVFARDPDALIDLVELELNEDILKLKEDKAICSIYAEAIKHFSPEYFNEHVSLDDLESTSQMTNHLKWSVKTGDIEQVEMELEIAKKQLKQETAWRIEGTLREFPKFPPKNIWFKYPRHLVDEIGVLNDIQPEDSAPSWKKNFGKKKSTAESKKERKESLETAIEACGIDEQITVKAVSEYMGISEKTVRNRIKEHGGFWIDEGVIGKKS